MKQVTIAKRLGITAQHLCDLKNGRKGWTPGMAKEVEMLLGVSRCECLWPEEFGSPWPKLASLPENFRIEERNFSIQ
jgi:hypothetical protein